MRTPATATTLLLAIAFASGQTFASNEIRPENLSSIRIEVPIATDDFSHLQNPTDELRDAIGNALVESGVPRERGGPKDPPGHYQVGPAGPRFIKQIESDIERTVRGALAHDGYAGRIWVHDLERGTLTKVIVVLYPSQNSAFSAVARAHESGHSAAHARAVETARHNATISGNPGKNEDLWIREIQEHEDDAAKAFHTRIGKTSVENLRNLGSNAEDPAVLEQIGIEAADLTLCRR